MRVLVSQRRIGAIYLHFGVEFPTDFCQMQIANRVRPWAISEMGRGQLAGSL
jgi:hypothetical protein